MLFHHDPEHDDAFVRRIEAEAAALRPGTWAAREGHTLAVPAAQKGQEDRAAEGIAA